MSGNVTDRLPKEVLSRVFDYLTCAEQAVVMTACRRWCSILSETHFVIQRRIQLVKHVEQGGNLDYFKRHRAFTVSSTHNQQTIKVIAKFLQSKEVTRRVEELRFDAFQRQLHEILGKRPLHLPKLKVLWVNALHSKIDNIVAPSLTYVLVDGAQILRYRRDSLPFMQQVVKLRFYTKYAERAYLRTSVGNSFEHLRHLELVGHIKFIQSDIDQLALVLRQLASLKVAADKCDSVTSRAVCRILPEGQNLRVLDVAGLSLSFQSLQNLTQLQELHLTDPVEDENLELAYTRCIIMPDLVKLTTQHNVAHLLVTPSLRVLSINGANTPILCLRQVSQYIFTICRQLTALRLSKVELTIGCVSMLCDIMPQLEILELDWVIIQRLHVEYIMRVLTEERRMHRIRFENCHYFDSQNENKAFYKSLVDRYPNCLVEVEFSERFERLCWLLEGHDQARALQLRRFMNM